MRYSLVSRFQGSLIGSLLGEIWVNYCQELENLSIPEHQLSQANQMIIDLTQRLLYSDQLFYHNWQQILEQSESLLSVNNNINSSKIALTTLPIGLFFHEDSNWLREQLLQVATICKYSEEILEDILIWGEAIALILREKRKPQQLIPQLLKKNQPVKTNLIQQLEQVQSFLEEGTPLAAVVNQLTRQGESGNIAIALAFYCFISTPEDFQLCLLRASQTNYQASLTASLTGALAGAYNSFSGIPIDWRLAIKKHQKAQKLYQTATQLFTVWSGVYQPDSKGLPQSTAIASVKVIQPRNSLKITAIFKRLD